MAVAWESGPHSKRPREGKWPKFFFFPQFYWYIIGTQHHVSVRCMMKWFVKLIAKLQESYSQGNLSPKVHHGGPGMCPISFSRCGFKTSSRHFFSYLFFFPFASQLAGRIHFLDTGQRQSLLVIIQGIMKSTRSKGKGRTKGEKLRTWKRRE